MAKASIKSLEKGITNRLNDMVEKASRARDFLERVVYRAYLDAQRKRWMTEGSSDGWGPLSQWAPLSATYQAMKLKRWAGAPGGGTKILIASGKLYQAVLGSGPGHRKIVTDTSIIVGVSGDDVPYAKYVNAKRPFFIFSDQMMQGLRDRYVKYATQRGGEQ